RKNAGAPNRIIAVELGEFAVYHGFVRVL
ncbi:MAG: hypothetical protein QOD67_3350, partial [Caballeronia sp.]|nr:hypothetical protein [Caballeronia sp.]